MFRNKNKKINNCEPNKKYFWLVVCVLIFSIFSYGFLFRNIITNIVDRQNMENELVNLSSRVLNLESEYISAKNNINMKTAQDMGFVAVASQKFMEKEGRNLGLSLVNNSN